ncbi:aminotransferase class I/II-fold pyridoxal phosphate-dependent enzyme [Nocardia mangyaensis]|uniref:aminotransferase class I/II-fold pyridoxal phosphate-dependent enzyme n=1 Tax=Nocardia mangyaensis TaxID=2213200 RepID=UPI00267591DC|nr:aminotransferase class I/II-fold pyridoxal phosphate-dependent enzyme [Nocardia mangyaensis]MDO3647922.1 aminotransferase class I/II-fold pyridoxal phosphate-dependent enzyme [Nocardia mangyaensis]
MSLAKFRERIDYAGMRLLVRELEDLGRSPIFRVMQSATTSHVQVAGRPRLMLGSNNYLGLATHPEVIAASHRALDRFGAASTGSRVANGSCEVHTELEAELADWHGTEAAMVVTTGYQANVGVVSALAGRGDAVVLDWAAHASLHDGAKMSGAQVSRFAHNDVVELRSILSEARSPVFVIVDSVYSMDGDIAPIDQIAALCTEFDALLMVDEAHGVGIFGAERTGAVELYGAGGAVDIRMGTLSKGIGSIGGYLAGSRDLIDYLRTHNRGYQFSTAGTPASIAAALAAVRVIRSAEGAELAHSLLGNSRLLRDALLSRGIPVQGTTVTPWGDDVIGPIVPVPVVDEPALVEQWNQLFERGIFAGISVFPGVRLGSPMLRLCVQATHSAPDLEFAADTIAETYCHAMEPSAS